MKSVLSSFVFCLLALYVNSWNYFIDYPVLTSNEKYWGPEHLRVLNNESIRPFKIEFDEEAIQDLKHRLRHHRRFTPPLEGTGFKYGFNTDCLDNWLSYWANEYDFKAREDFLNQYPQYKTNIQGLDIHFIWVKPEVPPNVEVVPLLFLHGWPGTVRELYDAIPYLTAGDEQRDFAVEVIVPSLPGFTFSDAAVRPGCGSGEMAIIFKNLMRRLGFRQFYVQGGDWGSRIASDMATMFPGLILGYHTNFAISQSPLSLAIWLAGSLDPSLVVDEENKNRLYPVKDVVGGLMKEMGYFFIQSTKPESLGVAMSDSPAGLLAYILQLFSSGASRSNVKTIDGDLEKHYSKDSLLDILTITWFTNSFTTSSRIYSQSVDAVNYNTSMATKPTTVLTWALHSKHEIFYMSTAMLQMKYPNLMDATVLDDGGHFLALEKPREFSNDVLKAIYAFRKWYQDKGLFRDEF